MHKPESILANEKYKILWDFEIAMDHLTSARHKKNIINSKNMKSVKKEIEKYRNLFNDDAI